MRARRTVLCLRDCWGAARLYSKCYYTIYFPRYILYPVFQFHSACRHEVNQANPRKFKARPLTVQLSTSITGCVICLPACLSGCMLQKQLPGFVSNLYFTLQTYTCSFQGLCVKWGGTSRIAGTSQMNERKWRGDHSTHRKPHSHKVRIEKIHSWRRQHGGLLSDSLSPLVMFQC